MGLGFDFGFDFGFKFIWTLDFLGKSPQKRFLEKSPQKRFLEKSPQKCFLEKSMAKRGEKCAKRRTIRRLSLLFADFSQIFPSFCALSQIFPSFCALFPKKCLKGKHQPRPPTIHPQNIIRLRINIHNKSSHIHSSHISIRRSELQD